MSKQVDLERKLTKDEVSYLVARDKWVELAYSVRTYGTELPESAIASLKARGYGVDGSPEDSEPPEPVKAVSGDGGTPEDPPEKKEPVKFSEEWFDKATVEELKTELRDPQRNLQVTGKRDELADRLWTHLDDAGELPEEEPPAGT